MVTEHGLLFFSLFVFLAMYKLGMSSMKPAISSQLQKIGNLLFPSYRRTVFVLFVCQLGITIDITLQVLPLLFAEVMIVSLFSFLLILSTLLFGVIISIGMANLIEDNRRKTSSSQFYLGLQTKMSTPCFRRLFEHRPEFKRSKNTSNNLKRLLTFLEREGLSRNACKTYL